MGIELRIGATSSPAPASVTPELGYRYVQNRLVLNRTRDFLTPPHEPVPDLPGLTEQGAAYLRSRSGHILVAGWAAVFGSTLALLDQFDKGSKTEADLQKVVNTQEDALHALTKRVLDLSSL